MSTSPARARWEYGRRRTASRRSTTSFTAPHPAADAARNERGNTMFSLTRPRVAALLLAATISTTAFAADPEWMSAVGDALGKAGKAMPGDIYRVGLARSDLKVTLDGVEIKPTLALGSWLAFAKHGKQGVVMGDLVLTANEVRRGRK